MQLVKTVVPKYAEVARVESKAFKSLWDQTACLRLGWIVRKNCPLFNREKEGEALVQLKALHPKCDIALGGMFLGPRAGTKTPHHNLAAPAWVKKVASEGP